METVDLHPLSSAQRRIWFIEQLRPGHSAYHIPLTRRFRGPLDVAALERSLTEIVRRHTVLRSIVVTAPDGEPMQRVLPPSAVRLPTIDVSSYDAPDRERMAVHVLSEETRRPFDLSAGPLIRGCIVRIGPSDHALLLVMHHIAFDGWSVGILAAEIGAYYSAAVAGRTPNLPDLPTQYSDFARWQRSQLADGAVESDLSYWVERLSGAPAVLELPADRPRPAVQSLRGSSVQFSIPLPLATAVRSLSARLGVTPFMTLLSAFKALLFRYTGQEDLVVGTLSAGRSQPETEALIGCFVNTLVLRTSVAGDPTFAGLAGRVRDVAADAYSRDGVPFETIVDALHLARGLRHAPLVQVVFGMDNTRTASGSPSMDPASLQPELTSVKFDVEASMFDDGEHLEGSLLYNADLFDRQTIRRLADHYVHVLEAVTRDPDLRISRIPLLDRQERQQLVVGYNRPRPHAIAPAPDEATLPALFERRAAEHPERVAVRWRDGSLTYGELNRRANAIAARLRRAGAGLESLVALLMDRSPEVVVAIVGALKAGAAYLPIEPDLPAERIEFLLRDAAPVAALTQTRHLDTLRGYSGTTIAVDADSAPAFDEDDERPRVSGDNAAYVFYTSGSTGAPKGVTVTHRNVVRLYDACQPWFEFGPDDVWLLYHSYAFDLSVWEIWGALLHGGSVVVATHAVSRDPAAMLELLSRERVTVLTQTPTAFKQLSEADERRPAPGLCLRAVVFAGEALDLPSLRRWFDRPGCRPAMINMYGITETTVHTTYRSVTATDTAPGTGSYVGPPLADLQVYILDRHLQPVPVGVTGEIHVAGPGLARGYFKRPDLTADRFIPDPFSSAGSRLYRSGDLARYRPDGDIEYLGRIDHQVKIRGFRVELGEIEATLAQHPLVAQCAVIARQHTSDDKRLVGYIVAAGERHPTVNELRSHLGAKLPPYMVPSAFVVLDALPLNANGKLDRKSLPDPPAVRPELEEAVAAPRTPLEGALARAFSTALGIEGIGIHDNFFALGGDSLRSVRAVGAARELGARVTLEQLFEHQTIERLAAVAEYSASPSGDGEGTPRHGPFDLVSPADRQKLPPDLEDAYPATMAQQGLLFHMRMNPDEPVYHNVDSLRFHVPAFDLEAFQAAIDHAVQRHPILRTSFDLTRYGEPLQLVHRTAHLPVGCTDLRAMPPDRRDAEVRAALDVEKARPFDLERAPLLRLHVHRLTDDEIAVTQTELHAIHDGWSTTSMWAEIFDTYSRAVRGERVVPAPLPSDALRDAVLMERAAMQSEETQRYWDGKLSDCAVLDLRDPEATGGMPRVRTVSVPIRTEAYAALTDLARRAGVPFKTVLLAAHVKALSIVSGRHDILTGMISHARPESVDGDKIRGFFLNPVPFRFKLAPSSWIDLVRRTFEAERELIPHQRYPLAALQKKWGKQTLLDTVFMFINFHVLKQLDTTGVRMSGVPYSVNDSHFPLMASFNMNKTFWEREFPDVELGIALQYDESRFTREFMGTVAEAYRQVIRSMHEVPERNHMARPMIAEEQHRRLMNWGRSAPVPPLDLTLPALVELRARTQPTAMAVADGHETLTYAQLNARANRLARCLAAKGVGADSVAAVLLPRSADFVTALLAIAKAGGAFLPLDEKTPDKRMATVLTNSHARVAITNEHGAARLGDAGCPLITMDRDRALLDGFASGNLSLPIDPSQLAYVIYTSGSTGQPKGVQIEHKSLLSLIRWGIHEFDLSPADKTTLLVSPAFDVMVWEVWASLAVGACLCVPDDMTRNTPAALVQWIADRGITVSVMPTPLAEAVLKEPWPSGARLRVLQTVGEALHSRPRAEHPFVFYNLYGPTENTVFSTSAVVPPSDRAELPSIGRAFDNVETYILDRYLQLVPQGVAGELCLGGIGVARGYRGRPDLTADRFVVHPFGEPGSRLYRTGDLARYRSDGAIEYLGRLDTQVKIRGFRVEVTEVEATIQAHPAVEQAVIVVDGGAQKRLVAYYVESPGRSVTRTELKADLAQTLPDYMIPNIFIKLDRLPTTASGKVDRKALPPPDPEPDAQETPYDPARNDLERRIADVWAQVLHRDRIGIHDNFFDIGGDSLRLLELHLALRTELGPSVEMIDLLQYSTVARFAERFATAGTRPRIRPRVRSRRRLIDRAQRRQQGAAPARSDAP